MKRAEPGRFREIRERQRLAARMLDALDVVEGQARKLNAIIRFPSKEAALGLYNDPAYQDAKQLRQSSTSNITMVLVGELR